MTTVIGASPGMIASSVTKTPPPPGSTITDSFNRPNNSTSLGNTDTGQPWKVHSGTWGIQDYGPPWSGIPKVFAAGDGHEVASVLFGEPDQAVQALFARRDINGLYARLSEDGLTGYLVNSHWQGGLYVSKRVGGVLTQLQSLAGAVPNEGMTIRFEVIGSSLVAKVDGVTKISFTDTAITTGNRAGMRQDVNMYGYLDDFSVRRP